MNDTLTVINKTCSGSRRGVCRNRG